MDPSPFYALQPVPSSGGTLSQKIVMIDAVSLDHFFKDKEILPDIIKIDVEGAETKVLKGMISLMKIHAPKVLVEVHPYNLGIFRSSVEELLSILLNSDTIPTCV